MNKYNKWFINILSIFTLFVALSCFAIADDVGKYYIQFPSCSTQQDALAIQYKISSLPNYRFLADENQSTTLNIIQVDNKYVVSIGNYSTYGDARFVVNMLKESGYTAVIQQIQPPMPALNSIAGTADMIYSQGTASYHDKLYAHATVYFTALVNQYPNDPNYYRSLRWMGYADILLNKPQEALKAFQTVANSASNLAAEAQLRVSYLYIQLNDLDNAKTNFQKLSVPRFSNNTSYVKEGQQQLIKLSATSPDDLLFKSANFALSAKNYTLVTTLSVQYIDKYPAGSKIDQAYYLLGVGRERAGDKIGALQAYNQVVQNPTTRLAGVSGVQLANVALSIGSTYYIDFAIDALRNSPQLSLSNQTIGGLLQTHIGYLILHGKVNQMKEEKGYLTLGDQSTCIEAINECRKVRELYPYADRMDLARSTLMEVEGRLAIDDDTTVISLAKDIITTYPDQKGYACSAQYIISRSYESLKDYQNALQAYQKLIDTYTQADNRSDVDDLIALTLYRKAKCLVQLQRNNEAKDALQEIISKHSQSSQVVFARRDLMNFDSTIIVLKEVDMKQIFGSFQVCHCYPTNCGLATSSCNCTSNPSNICPCAPGACVCRRKACGELNFFCGNNHTSPCTCGGGSLCHCVICSQNSQAKPCGGVVCGSCKSEGCKASDCDCAHNGDCTGHYYCICTFRNCSNGGCPTICKNHTAPPNPCHATSLTCTFSGCRKCLDGCVCGTNCSAYGRTCNHIG